MGRLTRPAPNSDAGIGSSLRCCALVGASAFLCYRQCQIGPLFSPLETYSTPYDNLVYSIIAPLYNTSDT
ncbi:hypothetical protein RSOLAG1IB_07591 [Rhizoctonia solani AG-1 IB]|uniref:Uncharacterized protein n=1 Tax=Thanatephorus cucumeris (strain AG1-IB / isolate 7/3/14) TaxID=1108050 RepID=A0A0B7FIT7_THACB|nr:hypothetical protein RSOLAG1IB_07591 [Rhizoctonia solani AG-1 IB]